MKQFMVSCKTSEYLGDIFEHIVANILGINISDKEEDNVQRLIKELEESEKQKNLETVLNIKKIDTSKTLKGSKIQKKLKKEILEKDISKSDNYSSACYIF